MFFNPRSLFKAALVSFFALETCALVLQPIPPTATPGPAVKRNNAPPSVDLSPIEDPWVMTHGHALKREVGVDVSFDPSSQSSFFWGAYAGDHIYTANFTMSAPGDDEFILPVQNFAKHLKSFSCGKPGAPMVLTFINQAAFTYAQKQWKWVDDQDINHFILVTEANQCYQGNDRSPWLVSSVKFDQQKLMATVTAQEKEWHEVARNFHLHLGHEYVDPATANVTHPHLKRSDGSSTMDLTMSVKQKLFDFAKDSSDTKGMALRADGEISTGGLLIADFDMETSWGIPQDVNINIHPQGAWGQILLNIDADGTLGKALDWALTPEIEIPVGALNIKGLLQIGPFVTFGVHFGSSALQGTGTITTGAKGTLKDSAEVKVQLKHPDQNSIKDWDPTFEKIDPAFSAEIGGNLRTWGELGVQIKVEALGHWGYQASVDAELPYLEATMAGKFDQLGVCGTQKTKGVDLGTNVGINVNLNAGPANGSPDFRKDLYETSWPLYTTCIGVGADDAKTPEPTPTEEPTPTDEPIETPISTDAGEITTDPAMPLTTAPPMATGTGLMGTATGSAGWPVTANSTFLRMAQRRPTALYF